MNEIVLALENNVITENQFDRLAVAINTGTNLPSVATPNGQAAFLFLLTSSLAPLIGLSYLKMVYKALPYTDSADSCWSCLCHLFHLMINHHKFCIAPMMKKTDKHFRFMARQFTKNSMLYTEMIHSNAILKGDADKLLKYHNSEHPVGLQLGGSDPRSLAEAAIIGEDFGYDEINLNVGCPSKKVKSGNFGVFLMKNVELLSSCINEVKKISTSPFTIKCQNRSR